MTSIWDGPNLLGRDQSRLELDAVGLPTIGANHKSIKLIIGLIGRRAQSPVWE